MYLLNIISANKLVKKRKDDRIYESHFEIFPDI